jgi:hypothetical protein
MTTSLASVRQGVAEKIHDPSSLCHFINLESELSTLVTITPENITDYHFALKLFSL